MILDSQRAMCEVAGVSATRDGMGEIVSFRGAMHGEKTGEMTGAMGESFVVALAITGR